MAGDGDDRELTGAVLAGGGAAPEQFLRRIASTVRAACRRLTPDETAAETAFATAILAISADGFACLKTFDARGRLDTFIALVVRDALAKDALRLAAADPATGWRRLEAMFGDDLRRLIARRLSGATWADERQDAYQEICAGLLADDCRRLAAYEGRGSPAGFLLHMADRLLVDFLRGLNSRRRMPASVTRLAALEQELFRLLWWEGMAVENVGATLKRKFDPPPSAATVKEALERLRRAVPAGYQPARRQLALSDIAEPQTDVSPESLLLAEEEGQRLAHAAQALRDVAAGFAQDEQLYLRVLLSGADDLPAREMARLLQKPVEDIYRLRQRVLKKLKEGLAGQEAVKNWLASV